MRNFFMHYGIEPSNLDAIDRLDETVRYGNRSLEDLLQFESRLKIVLSIIQNIEVSNNPDRGKMNHAYKSLADLLNYFESPNKYQLAIKNRDDVDIAGLLANLKDIDTIYYSGHEEFDLKKLPSELSQRNGPKFGMRDGRIQIAPPENPRSGILNKKRLQSMLPILRSIAGDANTLFGRNMAHAHIATALSAYLDALYGDVDEIDYDMLAAYGILLSNAEKAGRRNVLDRMAPELEDAEQAALGALLDLHGPFIMSTDAGQALLADAAAYSLRPDEELAFRNASIEIAEAIRDEGIATQSTAEFLVTTAENIGAGSHPARSSALGTNAVRNALVVLITGAALTVLPAWFALPAMWLPAVIIAEGVKKSQVGQNAANLIRDALNDPLQRKNLIKLAPFVLRHEAQLRDLAGSQRELNWLHSWLDWLKENEHGQNAS